MNTTNETIKNLGNNHNRPVLEAIFIDCFNGMSRAILEDNTKKGFWNEPRNFGEVIALMHSELSEALEAHRKNLMDQHLPNRKGIEVELADCVIRIMDTAAGFNLNIAAAIIEKLAYNRTREHKHGKAY